MEDKTKSTRHAKYNLNYHFVWIPKYRRNVLKGKKKDRVKDLLREIASPTSTALPSDFSQIHSGSP